MGAATDPFLKAVYNGRQAALKVSANSVYGGWEWWRWGPGVGPGVCGRPGVGGLSGY